MKITLKYQIEWALSEAALTALRDAILEGPDWESLGDAGVELEELHDAIGRAM